MDREDVATVPESGLGTHKTDEIISNSNQIYYGVCVPNTQGRAGMGEAAVVRTGHEQQQPLLISSNTKLVPPATPFLFPSDTEK